MDPIGEKYEILQPLREGGMGAIYKVRHRLLDEIRVVKVMRPQASENPDLRKRFLREAKMAIRVRHPNIGQLYDFAIDESGTAVIVMEFIDGVTLEDVLASGPTPSLPFVVDVAMQTLQALSCLHHHGIVHRDVSSDNVMLTSNFDGRPLVKLIDLGVAKDPGADATATLSGTFVGKARYAAPEQFRGSPDAPTTSATDLYAFAVLLYELLTGRLPVDGSSFAELAAGHLFHDPVPFDKSDPDDRVPEGLRVLVLDALHKDPSRRVSSAEVFAERLRPFAQDLRSDPLEFEQLLGRARELAARRAPATVRVAAAAASGVRRAAICDALLEPWLDPVSLEGLEILHRLRTAAPAAPTVPFGSGPTAGRTRPMPAAGVPAFEPRPRPRPEPPPRDEPDESEPDEVAELDGSAETRWAPRPRARAARPQARFTGLHAAVVAVVFAVGAAVAGFALWNARDVTDPLAEQISTALGLGEETGHAVETKLKRVVALTELLPADDERREELERHRERLTNLLELHNYVDRLEPLLEDARNAAGQPERAERAASDAENLWILLREYRRQFAGDDPAAQRVVDRGRSLLRQIGESTGTERLQQLADER